MRGMRAKEISIDEMWEVIENFGIAREIYERHNPSYSDIQALYLLIKSKKKNRQYK